MSKVIACIDGSVGTHSVCDYAAWFSQKLSAQLELLHVIDKVKVQTPQNFSGALGLGDREILLEEIVKLEESKAKAQIQHGELLLKEAKQYIHQQYDLAAYTFQRHGNLLETVVALEDEFRVLIMGKYGTNTDRLSEKIGTQIENIVRAIHKPILVSSSPFEQPKSFLIAFDGSPTAKVCVERIVASPLLIGLNAHLVYVGNPSQPIQSEIDWAKAQLQDAGFELKVNILEGEVEQAIINYADTQAISILVVGAYGHSKIRQFFIGSSTTKLISGSTKPVLLLR
ncbi:MAG: universal stress protein [Alcaligenaceae bacterium]|nr:universal stress protein [Alcaligenaceae bacterium]